MTTLIAPPDAADSAVEARTGCTLRISRRGDADRTYSLTSGKCTIGSSPRCHICLPAADARPIQCLVALETSATVVTRWAAGVLLNGREFATAPFGAGDRLSIGPWEIDVQSVAPPATPASPTVRETQDLIPQPLAEPEAELSFDLKPAIEVAPTAWEPSPDLPEPCEAPQPAFLPRPARASAQTIHMDDESAPLLLAAPRRLDCFTSQEFADRLLLKLWTANHFARNRCQALLAALHDARQLAEDAAAKCAAAESQLTQTASAHETQATHWKATRVTLEGELSALQTELAACNSQRDRLAAELAVLTDQSAQQAASHQHDESLLEAHAGLEQELTELRRQLSERDEQLTERDEQLTERDGRLQTLTVERASAVEALHVLDHQLRLEQERYEALVTHGEHRKSELDAIPPTAPLDRTPALEPSEIHLAATEAQFHARLDEPQAPWSVSDPEQLAAEAPATWAPLTPPTEEPNRSLFDAPSAAVESLANWDHDWRDDAAQPSAPTDAAPLFNPSHPAADVDDEVQSAPRVTSGSTQSATAPPVVAEEPKPEFVPVSFIDRYRNLLDDASDAGFESGSRRSLLDDEYLSPAQAKAHDDPVEESDEALDAYMSNLMRRVRGDSPPPGPTPAAKSRSKPLAAGLLASDADSFESTPEPEAPAEPFQLESIKRPARRPLNLDLAALREIANVTARTAIAEHRQRRHVESIITKVIISAMGVAAGAYALLAAPSFDSPWFWAGCLAATSSAGLAVQLCVVLRRRINRRRRHLDPQAANEYHSEPQIQISDFTTEYTEPTE